MASVFAVPLMFWIGWALAIALLGYASHLAADSATKSGLRPLDHKAPHKGWIVDCR